MTDPSVDLFGNIPAHGKQTLCELSGARAPGSQPGPLVCKESKACKNFSNLPILDGADLA